MSTIVPKQSVDQVTENLGVLKRKHAELSQPKTKKPNTGGSAYKIRKPSKFWPKRTERNELLPYPQWQPRDYHDELVAYMAARKDRPTGTPGQLPRFS